MKGIVIKNAAAIRIKGETTAQGEKVQQILVDGGIFFSDEPDLLAKTSRQMPFYKNNRQCFSLNINHQYRDFQFMPNGLNCFAIYNILDA